MSVELSKITPAKRYLRNNPWYPSYNHARDRCKPNGAYSKKGIKFLMTIEDFELLWNRDRADTMHRPSIDRINDNGNYEISNCRFIELADNFSRTRTKTIFIIDNWDESKTLRELTRVFNIKYPALFDITKRYFLNFKMTHQKERNYVSRIK